MTANADRRNPLSDRERNVLFLAADGLTDKEIAQRLGIGAKTVRTYWDRVRGKLGASSRTQALAMALRAAYDELAEREAQFRIFVERLPALFVAIDDVGRIVYVNQEAARLIGGSEETRSAQDILERLYPEPELRERVRQRWLRNREEFAGSELPIRTAQGELRTIAWYGHADASDPCPGAYWAIGVDVTERAHAADGARLDSAAFHALMEEADQGMWLLDAQCRTRHVNPPMARLLGTTVEDLTAKTPLDFVPKEDRDVFLAKAKAGGISRTPYLFTRADGTSVAVQKSLVPIQGPQGISGYLLVVAERGEPQAPDA